MQAELITVGERSHYNVDLRLDERVVVDGRDFTKTLAADVARILGPPSVAAGAAPSTVELEVTRVVSTLDRGGWTSLRGTIRGQLTIRGRVAGSDPAAPWPWTFEAAAEKRVFYIQVGDYVQTLESAYCRILEEIAARAPELATAGRVRTAG